MSFNNSRLIVKNLSKGVTEEEVKTLFSKEGVVTDLQLKYKKDGTFRNFAFVGYKTADEAQRALNALNNTYVRNTKICVEFCTSWHEYYTQPSSEVEKEKNGQRERISAKKLVKSEEWSKQSEDTEKGNQDEIENDPEFQEFLEAHRNIKTSKSKVWQNDDLEPSKAGKSEKKVKAKEVPKKKQKESVKGTYKNTIKLKGIPGAKCTKKNIIEFLQPFKPISLRIPRKCRTIAYAAFKTPEEVEKALAKHRNVMWGSLITVLKYEAKPDHNEVDSKYAHQKILSKEDSEAVLVDTGRIFVRNLCYSCKEEDLEELFKPFGEIAEIHLPIDKETKKIKGFGFVAFLFPEHALKAFSELDGIIFQGRNLHLLPGESKPAEKVSLSAKSSFKKKKESDEKKLATVGHNWNALFLGINALSDVISEKYDVKKSQLLMEGKPSESIAVRVALGETQLVNEMKKFLVSNGVKLDAFEKETPKRSKTIILVKNLPAKTTVDELNELFFKYATVSRIILPPMAITAIVELDNPVEAKTVFKKLAYRQFKSNPLYLEWAPLDLLSTSESEDSQPNQGSADQPTDTQPSTQKKELTSEETLLVKNLSKQTDEDKLREHFSECGKIKKVFIACKQTKDGTSKSLGYGFVEFKTRQGAEKAMKNLQNSSLDGSTLELKLSSKQKANEQAKAAQEKEAKLSEQTGTKILVRNVPFEASEKDVEQLFAVFGKIKSLRLPKKVTGSHRGFGFVDFLSKEDAKRAFESLSLSTHLLGRRLVLEWSVDEDQDGIRKSKAFAYSNQASKRLKKSNLLDDLEGKANVKAN